jgi:hypothetical protein
MKPQKKTIVIFMMFIFFFLGGIFRSIYLTYGFEWSKGLPQIMLALTFFMPLLLFDRSKTGASVIRRLLQLLIILVDLLLVAGLLFLGVYSYFQPLYKP